MLLYLEQEESRMTSYAAIRKATERLGVKIIADHMNLSPSLLYKWSEPTIQENGKNTNMNPLDRLAQLYALTGEMAPIAWLCKQANGFFVRNPSPTRQKPMLLIKASQQILREFSEMLEAISHSMEDDQKIDNAEAKSIRQNWEELKMVAESFVTACEHGACFSGTTMVRGKKKCTGKRK
jgi:hypothetical protein